MNSYFFIFPIERKSVDIYEKCVCSKGNHASRDNFHSQPSKREKEDILWKKALRM